MPALTNQRHEQFVEALLKGLSATRAYVQVYGEGPSAAQAASRLLRNVEVSARLIEVKNRAAERTIQLEISERNARVLALQDRWERMKRVIEQRGLEMADVPGGGDTGLLVRDYKGKDATAEVYKVDTGLLAEMRHHEQQAAEELGQWVTKSETTTIDIAEIVSRLNAGRKRAREAWEAQQQLTISGEVAQPCPTTGA